MKKTSSFVIGSIALVIACGQRAENVPTVTDSAAAPPAAAAKPGVAPGTALPDSAFKATWSTVEAPKTVKAGEMLHFKPTVRNDGDKPWPGKDTAPFNLVEAGARWVPANTAPADYVTRVSLPKTLAPGASHVFAIDIAAPATPGIYTLQFDLVQEGVAWFEWKGQPGPKFQVTVQ